VNHGLPDFVSGCQPFKEIKSAWRVQNSGDSAHLGVGADCVGSSLRRENVVLTLKALLQVVTVETSAPDARDKLGVVRVFELVPQHVVLEAMRFKKEVVLRLAEQLKGDVVLDVQPNLGGEVGQSRARRR
jgi:hypothetical protein